MESKAVMLYMEQRKQHGEVTDHGIEQIKGEVL